MIGSDEELLRWIPLLPLLAAVFHGLVLGLVRRPTPRFAVIGISCGSVLGSFAVSCVAFWSLVQQQDASRALFDDVYSWIGAGVGDEAFSADVAFALDPLSSLMVLLVTGVGFLIHIYSIGYARGDERDDKGFQRLFAYLDLLTFSMLVLVLADNLVLLFLGWEGVAVCSYLLIGFWYGDERSPRLASRAFVVGRIGDVAFLVGLFLLFSALSEAGSPGVSFRAVERHFAEIVAATVAVPAALGGEWRLVDAIGICFFVGACGKSAQLPLHVWLPDSVAGPAPASAVIHTTTTVAAGVYLVCRLSFLYAVAPAASALVAWTGAITALLAALVAVAQTDIKQVLAWSTMSQLGYVFLAVGCGDYAAAMFHLGTHAFFKALLLLSAGAIVVAVQGERNITRLGGLYRRIPKLHLLFLTGVLATVGFPGLSGFFSRDEILGAAYIAELPGGRWPYGIGLATVAITSYYMFRLHFRVFYGDCNAPASVRDRAIDPPDGWLQPLYVLAGFAVFVGFAGLPQAWADLFFDDLADSNSVANFLAPSLAGRATETLEHTTAYAMSAAAIFMGVAGFLAAAYLHLRRPDLPARLAARLSWPHRLLERGFYLDSLYGAIFVRPLLVVSDRVLFRAVETAVIDDTFVNGTARAIRGLGSHILKYTQSGGVRSYLLTMLAAAVALVGYLAARG